MLAITDVPAIAIDELLAPQHLPREASKRLSWAGDP